MSGVRMLRVLVVVLSGMLILCVGHSIPQRVAVSQRINANTTMWNQLNEIGINVRRRHDLYEVLQVPDVNFHSVETPDRNFDLKGLSAAHMLCCVL
jgi:hypothetical protein